MDSGLELHRFGETDFSCRPIYLLLEENPVIAADIIGTLEASGACDIMHLSDASMVRDALSQTSRLTAAILEMNPSDLLGSDIETALRRHEAQIVLTKGDQPDAEVEARGWKMLLRPFTEQMLRDILALTEMRFELPGT